MSELQISVVIPTRNRAQYLVQALESVFAQTYQPAEIIVIDDGSTDDTRTQLSDLIDAKKIRYVFQQPKGVSAARNKGIESALYPYIAFLDSDDLFLPTKLEKQIKLFENQPELGFVHCCFSKFTDQGRDLGTRDTSRHSGRIYPQILLEWSVLMAMPCMLARTEAIRNVGGFDESMIWAEDMDLWRRMSRRYEVGVVDEVLVRVRVHASSTTFERSSGISGFERFLEKAFQEDPQLSWTFRQRAKAKMYAKLGQNLLGDGTAEQMKLVRRYQAKAIRSWPFEVSALFNWLISFVPSGLRSSLAHAFRQWRYPASEDGKL